MGYSRTYSALLGRSSAARSLLRTRPMTKRLTHSVEPPSEAYADIDHGSAPLQEETPRIESSSFISARSIPSLPIPESVAPCDDCGEEADSSGSNLTETYTDGYDKGYSVGWDVGYNEGYADSVDNVQSTTNELIMELMGKIDALRKEVQELSERSNQPISVSGTFTASTDKQPL